MKFYPIFFFLLIHINLNSKILPIFIQKNRYSNVIFPKNSINYFFFGKHYIDKNDQNIIDLKSLENGINKKIPDVNTTDLIVLDIENDIYKGLKYKKYKSFNYSNNIKSMISMVDLVKCIRPHAKVVVYGLPFNFNSTQQKEFNNFDLLEPLLLKVDYISPSLYLYSDNQQENISYLKKNLDLFLDYSCRLNKPLVPFMWYRIHPSKVIIGGTVISDNMYEKYLSFISSYKKDNYKVDGLIYWEPSKSTIDINKKICQTFNILNS